MTINIDEYFDNASIGVRGNDGVARTKTVIDVLLSRWRLSEQRPVRLALKSKIDTAGLQPISGISPNRWLDCFSGNAGVGVLILVCGWDELLLLGFFSLAGECLFNLDSLSGS